MTKVTRYFHGDDSEQQNDKKPKKKLSRVTKKNQKVKKSNDAAEVLKYNVKIRKTTWGRKAEDRKQMKQAPNPNPRFPGHAPISAELLQKHSRGIGTAKKGIKTGVHRKIWEKKEKVLKNAHRQAAQAEVLLKEDVGFLKADVGETTTQYTQQQIIDNVDIAAAAKHFQLHLNDFGPYRMRYTRNGRHMLLGGKKGHVAAFDWVTKQLHCEMNVMESVDDVCWLHIETMFAVAQKDWVYIYDNQGIELHCVKRLNRITRMEFLPYHFLLAAASDDGYLSWLDVSIGQLAGRFNTKLGRLTMLTHNPYNAVLCLGHSKGIVSMWSPTSREPLAKMLCHRSPLTAVHVDPKGVYMATAAVNREVKIWDVRKLEGPLQSYKLSSVASSLNLSQKNMLAVGMGNIVEVYRDCCTTTAKRAYLRHRFNETIGNMNFCPFEDVLGVATSKGFTSLLVPGSGEANFDGYELNPYQTKSQRKEYEVKALLEKIQPDLITLDPTSIAEVDVPTLKDKVEMKQKLLSLKPPKIDYEPRNKAKGRGGTVNIARNKKIVQEQAKKEFIKNVKELQEPKKLAGKSKKKSTNVLDRFLPK